MNEKQDYRGWGMSVARDGSSSSIVRWTRLSATTGVSKYTIEIYFHKAELEDRNVFAQEGDFVEYGGIFYEITSATQPQIVFGQINNKVMVKCTCVASREGQFAAGGDSDVGRRTEKNIENVPGTPPVNRISTDATAAVNRFRLFPSGSL